MVVSTLGGVQPREHERLKAFESDAHCESHDKILQAKAVVDKEWDKLKQLTRWRRAKSTKQSRRRHFATLMDFCHLQHSDVAEQLQAHQGRVVRGGYAVLTAQGASLSHVTAAKVLEKISRFTSKGRRSK